jgi:hypothetical protein
LGWAAVADALENITSLTWFNGFFDYGAVRAGGVTELNRYWSYELGGWIPFMARYLELSAGTLTTLNVRCAAHQAWCTVDLECGVLIGNFSSIRTLSIRNQDPVREHMALCCACWILVLIAEGSCVTARASRTASTFVLSCPRA